MFVGMPKVSASIEGCSCEIFYNSRSRKYGSWILSRALRTSSRDLSCSFGSQAPY